MTTQTRPNHHQLGHTLSTLFVLSFGITLVPIAARMSGGWPDVGKCRPIKQSEHVLQLYKNTQTLIKHNETHQKKSIQWHIVLPLLESALEFSKKALEQPSLHEVLFEVRDTQRDTAAIKNAVTVIKNTTEKAVKRECCGEAYAKPKQAIPGSAVMRLVVQGFAGEHGASPAGLPSRGLTSWSQTNATRTNPLKDVMKAYPYELKPAFQSLPILFCR